MDMQLRYRYRLEPTVAQQQVLARTFGCVRVVWNDALAMSRRLHEQGEKYPGAAALQRLVITQAKLSAERSWLSESSNVTQQQSVRDLDLAYRNWWKSISGKRKGPKVRAPRFKSKHDTRQAARFTRQSFRVLDNDKLRITKVGDIKVRWSRDLPSAPSSCTIIKDAAGRYFASFVVEIDRPQLEPNGNTVGIDLGTVQFASFNTGEQIEGPKPLKRNLRKLRCLQRALKRMDRTCIRTNKVTGRKQRGSHRYHHQRRRIARLHARIADVRKDFQEKLSTRLIHENQVIVLEDLRVSAMLKAPKPKLDEFCNRWLPNGRASKRGLARAISDAGWRQFRTMLEQKAERYGRELRLVNPAFTSQRCSCCGHIEKANRKTQATFKCLACGHNENADVNAAKNILAAGQAARPSASCAESPERGLKKRTAEPQRQPRVKSRAAGCEASTHPPYRTERMSMDMSNPHPLPSPSTHHLGFQFL